MFIFLGVFEDVYFYGMKGWMNYLFCFLILSGFYFIIEYKFMIKLGLKMKFVFEFKNRLLNIKKM